METAPQLLDAVAELVPTAIASFAAIVVLLAANWLLLGRAPGMSAGDRIPRQLFMLVLTGVAIVCIVLVLPIAASTRDQLLGLLGLVLTAVIGLSSTTFVTNAMAGVMLRVVDNFGPGDFVGVGDHFGRVSERGLFHTELQTEDRDLTTLPNLFLVSNPVKVVRASGTVVSADVSLGYDVDHARVEPLLCAAAANAGLESPFVQITALGDFSVAYRIAGVLPEVKQLLSVRSDLRRQMLDVLHGDGIEITSPNFMAQRPLEPGWQAIPERTATSRGSETMAAPEAVVFDKADAAEKLAELRAAHAELKEEVAVLEKEIEGASDEEKAFKEGRLRIRRAQLAATKSAIERKREQAED